jgi:hypothetical protein
VSCCPSCAGGAGECTAPVPTIVGVDTRNFWGYEPPRRRVAARPTFAPVDTSRGAMTPEQARAARARPAAPELPGPSAPAPVALRLPPSAFVTAFRATSSRAARAVAPAFRAPPTQFVEPTNDGAELLDVSALVAAAEAGDPDALEFLAMLLADEAQDDAAVEVGAEIPREVRAVDDVLSAVWDIARPFVPYGDVVEQVHQARRTAMYGPSAAAPRGGRADRSAPRETPSQGRQDGRNLNAPGLIIQTRTPGAVRVVAPPPSAPGLSTAGKQAVAGIQRVVRDAARGDAGARDELVSLKEGAARGDAAARRRWSAAVAAMRSDDARIDRLYRAAMGAA